VRFSNPTNGQDALPTMRTEMHRLKAGTRSLTKREVGSSVYQVFDGNGTVTVGERTWQVARGDLFVVPSWQPLTVCANDTPSPQASQTLDLFCFSDAPIFEALHSHRVELVQAT
jgi:gentisate 1,2-dioxygenase